HLSGPRTIPKFGKCGRLDPVISEISLRAPRAGSTPLEPPAPLGAGERVRAEVRDHALPRRPGAPRRDAVQRETMDQICLAGPSGNRHSAARFEAFAPSPDVG